MKRTDLPMRAQELLRTMRYVTIATSDSKGQPWNTPMVGHFDDELNLYWVSARASQHSRNIRGNPRIFVVLYRTEVADGEGYALYLQMVARELSSSPQIAAAKQLSGITLTEQLPGHQEFLGDCPRRVYAAKPIHLWCNYNQDQDGHYLDFRRELQVTVGESATMRL